MNKYLMITLLLYFKPGILTVSSTELTFGGHAPSFLQTVQLGDKNYLFVSDVTMTWYDALVFCQVINMKLVSIETSQENELILNHIKTKGWTRKIFYTSGTSLGTCNDFYWASQQKRFEFTDWGPYQPDNVTSMDKCITLFQYLAGNWTRMYWNDSSCNSQLHIICET